MPIQISQFSPIELGLPNKFGDFREIQVEAIEQVLEGEKRVQGLCLPTGAGKSLVAMAIAKATGLRTAILTSTKGLQTQYLADYSESGLVDIRGKANYACADLKNLSCRWGEVEGCRFAKMGGHTCTYEAERWTAKQSQIVLTNYAYWVRVNMKGAGIQYTDAEARSYNSGAANPVELLVLDEAHRAMEELSKCLSVQVKESWLANHSISYDKRAATIDEWKDQAGLMAVEAELKYNAALDDLKQKPSKHARDKVYELGEVLESLGAISVMKAQHWVVDARQGTNFGRWWVFDCIWPGALAESRLFNGATKIVAMSATLKPMALGMLGLKKEDYDFREWPAVFEARRTPCLHVKTVRLSHRSEQKDLDKWVRRIDEILDSRADGLKRNGIIHTVSYARQKYLMEHSRHTRRMLANTSDPDSATAQEIVDWFKSNTGEGWALVSPSFATGWDFPGDTCRWQIIAKVPIPDSRSPVMQARMERNPKYVDYLAMQEFVQARGRGTRSEEDWCEVFCVDDMIQWFLGKNRGLAPREFEVRTVSEVPEPIDFS